MKPRRRMLLLGLLLALTFSAAAWVTEQEENGVAVVAPAPRRSAPRTDTSAPQDKGPAGVLLEKLSRTPASVGELNPFGAKSWYVPPPPPPPQPVPKPTAPPLPFSYIGKLEEDGGQWIVYLAKGDQSFVVKKGETFDNNAYRLEGIENNNLVIQYLPLPTRQLLPLGGKF